MINICICFNTADQTDVNAALIEEKKSLKILSLDMSGIWAINWTPAQVSMAYGCYLGPPFVSGFVKSVCVWIVRRRTLLEEIVEE